MYVSINVSQLCLYLFACLSISSYFYVCPYLSQCMWPSMSLNYVSVCTHVCQSLPPSLSLSLSLSLFVYLFFHFCSTQTRKRDWAFLRIFVNLLIAIFCLKMVETLPTDDSVQSERCTVTLSQIKKRRKLFIKWWLFWLSRPLLSVNIPKTCLHKCGISFDHRLML